MRCGSSDLSMDDDCSADDAFDSVFDAASGPLKD